MITTALFFILDHFGLLDRFEAAGTSDRAWVQAAITAGEIALLCLGVWLIVK